MSSHPARHISTSTVAAMAAGTTTPSIQKAEADVICSVSHSKFMPKGGQGAAESCGMPIGESHRVRGEPGCDVELVTGVDECVGVLAELASHRAEAPIQTVQSDELATVGALRQQVLDTVELGPHFADGVTE
jgi:hypothetical protein